VLQRDKRTQRYPRALQPVRGMLYLRDIKIQELAVAAGVRHATASNVLRGAELANEPILRALRALLPDVPVEEMFDQERLELLRQRPWFEEVVR
jgi:hypothetical protein